MTTDKERREVARRLREAGEELGSAALLWYHIAKALGVRTATDGKTACGMLADLIEPSCDRDALLALADEIEEKAQFARASTEHAVIYAGYAREYESFARRIREACGEGER